MDSLLRDIQRERSKMLADIENLNRHTEKMQSITQQYITQAVIEWSKLIVSHPKALLLIVETNQIIENGYASGEHEPVRFTAYSTTDKKLILDRLIRPSHNSSVQGHEYHGLLMSDLADQPRIAAIWSDIHAALEDHHIIIFGADWARNALRSVYPTRLLDNAYCLHNKCKEYYSEFYDLSLERVLAYQGIDTKRDELRDSQERILMLAQVIRNLAQGMPKKAQEPETDDDMDKHPF